MLEKQLTLARLAPVCARVCLAVAAAAPHFGAQASETLSNVTITSVRTYETYAWVTYSGTPTSFCAGSTTYPNVFIIDWTTDAARKTVYASLLVAYTLGKPVTVSASSCYDYGPGVAQLPSEYVLTF